MYEEARYPNLYDLEHGGHTQKEQSAYPDLFSASAVQQSQPLPASRKRAYQEEASIFFEDAKRSRMEPVYNPIMAERLSTLDTYLHDGGFFFDSPPQQQQQLLPEGPLFSDGTLTALQTKQDLLDFDAWLLQLSGTFPGQEGFEDPTSALYAQSQFSPGSEYPGLQMKQDTIGLYPTLPLSLYQQPLYGDTLGLASTSTLPMLAGDAGLFASGRRHLNLGQLQAPRPASPGLRLSRGAPESNVRDAPLAPPQPAAVGTKEETIAERVGKLTLQEKEEQEKQEVATQERVKRHAAMIRRLRLAIHRQVERLEGKQHVKSTVMGARPAVAV